jgi:hypothetical protein
MDGPRRQFFAGSGLAADVDAHIKFTDQADVSNGSFEATRLPDQIHGNERIPDNLFGLSIHGSQPMQAWWPFIGCAFKRTRNCGSLL